MGGSSELYKVYDFNNYSNCMIKIHALSELKINPELKHPNIVDCYGYEELDSNSFKSATYTHDNY